MVILNVLYKKAFQKFAVNTLMFFAVPRDRNSSFEPQIIKKRQTVLNEELDNKILALYGLGTSYEDITAHLQEIYGVDV